MGKEPSHEVDEHQLEIAEMEGDAYREALRYMIEEVAHTGRVVEVEDYVVGFAQEEAEGLYRFEDGELVWREPDESMNAHFEVAVLDRDDRRFIPYLEVTMTVVPEEGEKLSFGLPFIWHPGLFHYGRNVELPGDGIYDIVIRVEPPTFHRHDRDNGDRYTEPVEMEFGGVEISTGREEV